MTETIKRDIFICPKCKSELEVFAKSYKCNNCGGSYQYDSSSIFFPSKKLQSQLKEESRILINNIQELGYDEGINQFLKSYPDFESDLKNIKFNQNIDSIFHGLTFNNSLCLEIFDDFGNSSETLSMMFDRVFSIKQDDNLVKFQKIRLDKSSIKNVKTIKCNVFSLPFNDNQFDLIVCDNLFKFIPENIDKKNRKKLEEEILIEIKRVLSKEGCLCFGIQNKKGINIFFEGRKENKKSLYDYHYLSDLLNRVELKTDSYWVSTSFQNPIFSAPINDIISTKWIFQNLKMFMKDTKRNFKINFSSFFSKFFSDRIIKFFIENFSPAYIFCCFKENKSTTVESSLKEKIMLKNYITLSRPQKISWIFFDPKANPKKIIHLERHKLNYPLEIPSEQKNGLNNNKIWSDEWKKGHKLNINDVKEIHEVIKWLFEFQNKNVGIRYTQNEIESEINSLREISRYSSQDNNKIYQSWIDKYQDILNYEKIRHTLVHGDFWYSNILIDSERNLINVIDWEMLQLKGNPFFDLGTFLIRWTTNSRNPVKEFSSVLKKDGKFQKLCILSQNTIDQHYGIHVDMFLILGIYLIRNIIIESSKSRTTKEYEKMLEILTNYIKLD